MGLGRYFFVSKVPHDFGINMASGCSGWLYIPYLSWSTWVSPPAPAPFVPGTTAHARRGASWAAASRRWYGISWSHHEILECFPWSHHDSVVFSSCDFMGTFLMYLRWRFFCACMLALNAVKIRMFKDLTGFIAFDAYMSWDIMRDLWG